ncbi:hypothetical protein [Paenibacillus sp. J2TS4]|uniref:hypothetical protein n=1 Tax=Paenibacillus sp. J2TS4 TaxID=2807194 RepID=UPI0020BF35DE|nr:hypothetical protein [Paenibacillus sp. J2TS4]
MNREELKKMIDHITEQDAVEVLDFIGYLNMKRECEALNNFERASVSSMDFGIMKWITGAGMMFKQGDILLISIPIY